MKLTNSRNLFIYHLWSLFYDEIFDRHFASRGRRRVFEMLDIQPDEQVLLVGVGTGADILLLPKCALAIGIDLSREMLHRASKKLPMLESRVEIIQADAQWLPLSTGAFDCAILNLILSVVPSGSTCYHETMRAIKPGGRVIVFDKFISDHEQLTLGRRFLNLFTTLIGTDITRRLSDIIGAINCTKTHDEPSLLHGAYRIILLEKSIAG